MTRKTITGRAAVEFHAIPATDRLRCGSSAETVI
jgi:hypothetical protein